MTAKTLIMRSQALIILLLSLPSITDAQLQSNGTGGGDWTLPSTWNGVSIPSGSFLIRAGDVVTAGPDAFLNAPNQRAQIYGTLTVDGADLTVQRINYNQTSSGTLNVKSGRLRATQLTTNNDSNFTVNLTGGLLHISELTLGANTFNVTGGRLATRGLAGEVHLSSGGVVEFINGMGSFSAMGNINSTWEGGRVYANTATAGYTAWNQLQGKWESNAINELVMSSKDTAQSFSASSSVGVYQGTLGFNIYSPVENDIFIAESFNLGAGVLIKVEGVNLEGSIEDYLGASFQILEATDNNYGNISATVEPSSLIIGGQLYENIEWDFSKLSTNGSITLVPEPSTYSLIFGSLVIGLAIIRRRKQAA